MKAPEIPDLEDWQRDAADLLAAATTARQLKRAFPKYLVIIGLFTALLSAGITYLVFTATSGDERNLAKRVDRNARIARQIARQNKREHQVLLCFFSSPRWRVAPLDTLLRCQRLVVTGRFEFPPGLLERAESSGREDEPSDNATAIFVEPSQQEPAPKREPNDEPKEEPPEEPPPSRPPPTKSPSPEPSSTPIVCTPEVDPLPVVCLQEPPFMSLLVAAVVIAVVA